MEVSGTGVLERGNGKSWSKPRLAMVRSSTRMTLSSAVLRVKQAEGADAVKALGRDVLQEAAQELLNRQGHGLVLPVATVAVSKRDVSVVVGGEQCLARERRAVHVSPQVAPARARLRAPPASQRRSRLSTRSPRAM
jgi:hypothetical protein